MMDDNNIRQVSNNLRATTEALQVMGEILVGEVIDEVQTGMQRDGNPVVYPIQWDSERQRRAFFATDGFGKGIPYQRTGGYVAAWHQEQIPFGRALVGPHPAGAIGGMPSGWQSRIHRGRWPYLLQVLASALDKMPEKIVNLIIKVIAGRND